MGKIRILSEDIANKIAAGEVVERPSSVVKELVENSIDALSSKITVSTQQGGKQNITIIDNGTGMDYDDVLLAFERHSTSKIANLKDLNEIKTLGFRGEALPSIASVSYFILESKTRDEDVGTKITIWGGKIKKLERVACVEGTRIEARNLFFNMPARKKFLRSTAYESSLISTIMINYALAHPEIHFYFEEIHKHQQDYPAVRSLEERIYQIYGKSSVEQSIPLHGEHAGFTIAGRIGFPTYLRPNRNAMHFFVNTRYVRDRIMMSAIIDAYKPFLKEATYPFIVLYITIPYDQVDVNVHPAKTEVRFFDTNSIHTAIKEGIASALGQFKPISIFPLKNILDTDSATVSSYPAQNQNLTAPIKPEKPELPYSIPQAMYIPSIQKAEIPSDSLIEKPPMIIGQFNNCYIIASHQNELLIIDQHVAHERILYEEYRKLMMQGNVPVQYLLLPLPIDVTPTQKILILEHTKSLEELGFFLEPFGGNTFLLKGIPILIKNVELLEMIIKIIDDFQNIEKKTDKAHLMDNFITSVACRAAIKINMPLTKEKMQFLIEELMKTSIPQVCPHGRPIIMTITNYQIDKAFKRK